MLLRRVMRGFSTRYWAKQFIDLEAIELRCIKNWARFFLIKIALYSKLIETVDQLVMVIKDICLGFVFQCLGDTT